MNQYTINIKGIISNLDEIEKQLKAKTVSINIKAKTDHSQIQTDLQKQINRLVGGAETLSNQAISKTKVQLANLRAEYKRLFDTIDIKDFQQRIKNQLDRLQIGKEKVFAQPEIQSGLKAILSDLEKVGTTGGKSFKQIRTDVDTFKVKVAQSANAMTLLRKEADSFSKTFIKDLGKMAIWGIAAAAIYGPIRSFRKGIEYVTELDSALNELQRVSGSTADSLKSITVQAFSLGNEVARTGAEVVKITTDFVKMGYTIQQSLDLSKQAMILSNVGENIQNVDEASSALIATLKGFNMEASATEHIVDALSEVANKYAVDTADLAYGIKILSATLAQSGTSFEQTLAMLTSATEVLQDAEKASYGINMISQRLRGLDEEGNNVADLIPKLQKAFKEISGVDILNEQTNQLRSTYDIILDVSKVWNTLTVNQQQYLAELAAGNRQVKVFNALMANSKVLVDAVNVGLNSTGSAYRKNAVFLESINGKVQKFNNTVQQMWATLIDSKVIKGLIDFGTNIVKTFGNMHTMVALLGTILSLVFGTQLTKLFINVSTGAKGLAAFAQNIIRTRGAIIKMSEAEIIAAASTKGLALSWNALKIAFMSNPLGFVATAILTIVSAIDLFNIAQEDANQKIQENIDKYRQQQSAVDSLISQYEQNAELAKSDINAKNTLIDIEVQLYTMFGESAKAINLETGAIEDNISKIRALNKEKLQQYIDENKLIAEQNRLKLESVSRGDIYFTSGERLFTTEKIAHLQVSAYQTLTLEEYINKLRELQHVISTGDIEGAKRLRLHLELLDNQARVNVLKQITEELKKAQEEYERLYNPIIALEEAYNRLGTAEEKQADKPPIVEKETLKSISEINDNINSLINDISNLSSAYETLASGEQLSTDAMIDLIQKYPEIAQYLATTNDLTLKKGQLLKEVASIQIKEAISTLEAEKAKHAGLMLSYSQQAQALRNVIAMNVTLNAVLGGQLATAEEAAKVERDTLLAIDAQIKALNNSISSLFSGGTSGASKSKTDKLKAQLDLEQEIYRAIIDTYERELEAARKAHEAKVAFLENEKEKVLALKEAYDDEYDAEQKRYELEELYRKRSNLILAGQQSSASLVALEQQIRDKEKAMQKEAIDTRFDKQVNYIDNMLKETKDAFDEIQNHYDELLKDTETIWKRVAEIMKGGTQNIVSFLEGNLEEFLRASPNQQAQMIKDWLKLIQSSGVGTNNIASLISSKLKRGNKGEDVKILQRALNELGYRAGIIDGIFGSNTEAALKRFQKAMGIAQSGVLDEETKKKFKLVGYSEGGVFKNDGIPYLHKGERILTAEQTKSFDLLVHNLTSVYSPLKNLLDFFKFPQVNTSNKSVGDTNIKVIFEGARFDTPENARKTTQEIKNSLNEIFKDMNRKGGLQNNVIIRR